MVNAGRALLMFLLAIPLFAAACSGGTSSPATPTVAATASPTPQATVTSDATATPTAASTPSGATVQSTVQLVDVRSGKVTTLYQDSNNAAYDARFDGDTVVVGAGTGTLAFHLDGSPASVPAAQPCQPPGQKPIYCNFSPDGRRVIYPVENGQKSLASGYVVPLWDQWVMEVATGKTQMVQPGLVHCGGCDGRYGPVWSPSSRYVAYAELGGEGRRFLTDAQSGATRQIGTGAEVGEAPVFSADGNRLLYQEEDNGTVARLEDLSTGTSVVLTIPWPAAFDTSGALVYSPAWNGDPKGSPPTTTVVDAATGKTVAQLAGAPPQWFGWSPGIAVGASSGGFVAALQSAPTCDGTAIYTDAGAHSECIAGGAEGRVAPNGRYVAVARLTGSIPGPNVNAVAINVYAINVVAVGGPTTTVVTGAASFQPPLMVWNTAGTYLLVLWPHATGL